MLLLLWLLVCSSFFTISEAYHKLPALALILTEALIRIMSSELELTWAGVLYNCPWVHYQQFTVFQFPNILCNRLSHYLLKGTVSDIESLKINICRRITRKISKLMSAVILFMPSSTILICFMLTVFTVGSDFFVENY